MDHTMKMILDGFIAVAFLVVLILIAINYGINHLRKSLRKQ
jgi:hypothetical protein